MSKQNSDKLKWKISTDNPSHNKLHRPEFIVLGNIKSWVCNCQMWWSIWRAFAGITASVFCLGVSQLSPLGKKPTNHLQEVSLPPCSVGQLPSTDHCALKWTHSKMWRQPHHFLDVRLQAKGNQGVWKVVTLSSAKDQENFLSSFFRSGQTTFESHSQHGEHDWLALLSPEPIQTAQRQWLVQILAGSQQKNDRRKM